MNIYTVAVVVGTAAHSVVLYGQILAGSLTQAQNSLMDAIDVRDVDWVYLGTVQVQKDLVLGYSVTVDIPGD